MAFKERVPGVWTPEKVGDSITGVFVGQDDDVGNFKSTVYHLDVKGTITSVWGSAALKPKMLGINVGKLIKIEFVGTAPSKKGEDTKLFKVYEDDGSDTETSNVPIEKPTETSNVPIEKPTETSNVPIEKPTETSNVPIEKPTETSNVPIERPGETPQQ